jgi:hypothetical protein
MPQNYTTHNVHVNQQLFDQLQLMPELAPPAPGFMYHAYRVVDVRLTSGTTLEGLLVIGDTLLLPPDVPTFEPEDVVEMTSTPLERHPDFTITDRSAVEGELATEWMNIERLHMFGPPEVEPDPRDLQLDEAWDEALKDDHRIDTYGGEIPACYHGPHLEALCAGGLRISFLRAQDDERETRVVRPRGIALWAGLLGSDCAIDPDFTLGSLMDLLDLPEETARYVFVASMPHYYGSRTFAEWLDAVRAEAQRDTELDYLQIGCYADTSSERTVSFYYGVSAVSHPLAQDCKDTMTAAGETINYSTSCVPIATIRHLPIRLEGELVVPDTHEAIMAHRRGPWRAWKMGGQQGPEPESPVLMRARRDISLADLIGSVVSELSRTLPGSD